MRLRSPVTGRALATAGHAMEAPGERWPVVDGIAFLRADRRALADEALARLDAGDREGAAVALLCDQDGWARTPPPDQAARREVVRRQGALSFREAMDLLAFGPVATYFAHRWTDPTFLSGLALAQAFWGTPRQVLELACGAGHYLRAFAGHAAEVTGGDLVFAKLWLARHFVAPGARLVCFDAAAAWPFMDAAVDVLFCHDAFYFLPDKPFVAQEMLRVSGRVLVGHMHNALADNWSSGAPLSPGDYAALFPDPVLFDDRELTAALIEMRRPCPASAGGLAEAAAIAVASRAGAPGQASGVLTGPEAGAVLRRNPLYRDGAVRWPSERYEREYATLATYPARSAAPARAVAGEADAGMVRRRELVDLPERW